LCGDVCERVRGRELVASIELHGGACCKVQVNKWCQNCVGVVRVCLTSERECDRCSP
jgi:hypothetical protein